MNENTRFGLISPLKPRQNDKKNARFGLISPLKLRQNDKKNARFGGVSLAVSKIICNFAVLKQM